MQCNRSIFAIQLYYPALLTSLSVHLSNLHIPSRDVLLFRITSVYISTGINTYSVDKGMRRQWLSFLVSERMSVGGDRD